MNIPPSFASATLGLKFHKFINLFFLLFSMNQTERVIIFIDGSNFYHLLKDIFGKSKTLMNFDFENFTKFIVKDRRLVRTYYYSAPLDRKKDEETYSKQQKIF